MHEMSTHPSIEQRVSTISLSSHDVQRAVDAVIAALK